MTTTIDFKARAPSVQKFWEGKGLNIKTETWRDVWEESHDKAFMVAGVANAELLSDIKALMDKAMAEGTNYKEWCKNFKEIAENRGWTTWDNYNDAKKAWRMRTIYETNMRTSYAAGRYKKLKEAEVPFWIYRHSDYVSNPRPHHVALDGLCLPADDPFWETHYPPNGWGCQCYVEGSIKQRGSFEGMKKRAAVVPPADEGWNYAPGASLIEKGFLEKKAADIPPNYLKTMMTWLAGTLYNVAELKKGKSYSSFYAQAKPASGKRWEKNKSFKVGEIDAQLEKALKERGVALESTAIVQRNQDITHATRKSKGDKRIADEWLEKMPDHLKKADAVFFDKTQETPALLFVFKHEGGKAKKVTVKVNENLGHGKKANILRTSGIITTPQGLQGANYELLRGDYFWLNKK